MFGPDRVELNCYAQELFAGIFAATPWTLKEVPQENRTSTPGKYSHLQ